MPDRLTIDTLPLGNGTLAICRLPGLSGAMDADLATIDRLHPDLVLTLTERSELRRLGLAGLLSALDTGRFLWRHFPIPDFGLPTGDAQWPGLSLLAHEVLGHGGTVLVHCRGGLGRSGMIALRLMVELGEDPNAALIRLRAARPGAVETDAQRDWASLPAS